MPKTLKAQGTQADFFLDRTGRIFSLPRKSLKNTEQRNTVLRQAQDKISLITQIF